MLKETTNQGANEMTTTVKSPRRQLENQIDDQFNLLDAALLRMGLDAGQRAEIEVTVVQIARLEKEWAKTPS